MTKTYKITGMTCGSCVAKVKTALLSVVEVKEVVIHKEDESATVTLDTEVSITTLQNVLDSKYSISDAIKIESKQKQRSWFATYKPILLLFLYIFLIAALVEVNSISIDTRRWMRHFMAGFFIAFSFFKLLDLKGFVQSFSSYDILARRIPYWGYCYAFFEFILGGAFLMDFNPVLTNISTLVLMSVSSIGVIQSVWSHKNIKCACLGNVFNLPMSTVTIVENGLMIAMSLYMLIL
ncbi:MAG: heavy-metal-associated domain-containing protein [Flavicella sp.]